jgi:hypothetical protein
MGTTSSDTVQSGTAHNHVFTVPGQSSHTHGITILSHSHNVDIPSHSHALDFGIKELAISDLAIDIYVDGIKRSSVSLQQGIIDLTAYIATTGWHTIELRSTTLKRISAQINIKSYIKS